MRYSPFGDWLDTKEQILRGIDLFVKKIRKREMKAGIWIAPFVASPSSKLFKDRNNWFLKDINGNDF
jgi:alpha-galactosidase